MDDEYLQPNKNRLPPIMYHKWRKAALVVEYISIVITFALAVASFTASETADSTSLLGLSFDSLLAIFSSGCIVWRFMKTENEKKGETLDVANPRERKACYAVGTAFVFTAVLIFCDAVRSLIVDNEPTQPQQMVIVSSVGAVALLLLFYAKYTIADKLQSRAMKTDAFDSAAGAVTAASIIVCAVLNEKYPKKLWFLDEVVALFIGLATFVYGVQTLHLAVNGARNVKKTDK